MAHINVYNILPTSHSKRQSTRSFWSLSSRSRSLLYRVAFYTLIGSFVLATTLIARHASKRDPGSWFFDPDIAYSHQYTATRQRQAEAFIAAASGAAPHYSEATSDTGICIGILSVARNGTRYLRSTVGSLLAGLSHEERSGIHLTVFLAQTDPTSHPAYYEDWLPNTVDEILSYNVSDAELEYVKQLEREDVEHRTKGLYDYTYLMKACYAQGTPYIAIIEDDVIAMDGWYHRTVKGIGQARTRTGHGDGVSDDFLYLRLFYTEEYFGWNKENWLICTFCSVMVFVGVSLLVYSARSTFPYMRHLLTPEACLAICLGLVPWTIILFFATGKATVLPLPPGINRMNNYGCCAQGLVYPRHKAHDLIEWYESSKIGYADMFTEQYANKHGEQRWALTPSVLQHLGSKSSKPDDWGHGAKFSKSVAGTIWNFAFEMNSPKALREEHELAAISPEAITAMR